MSKNLETGKKGEQIAKEYLTKQGFQILETNWRFSRAEIDIIALEEQVLVFVEVKTRSTDLFGPPELAVSDKKKVLLVDAANAYMEQIQHDWEIRFDIISIILKSGHHQIEHFKDAFFPGW